MQFPNQPAIRPPFAVFAIWAFAVGFAVGCRTVPMSSTDELPEPDAIASEETARDTAPERPRVLPNGRPRLEPLPVAEEVWECQVVVIGGSLGGVAAATHAMHSGAQTCTIERSPWFGGQISSQGVAAIDESLTMRALQNFSQSWQAFKDAIARRPVRVPSDVTLPDSTRVADVNSCWVGDLCFPPEAGAAAAISVLEDAATRSPNSRWGARIAFKGAEFDAAGREIAAIYAVRRVPSNPDRIPSGRLSQELYAWYAWTSDDTFEKIPLYLQPPPGERMLVIDATDTGEFVGWADIPYRLGSESVATTGEVHASDRDNPACTQAFTYPFALAIRDDGGRSRDALAHEPLAFSADEHRRSFKLHGYPFFAGRSFFHYRRGFSVTRNDPNTGMPARGDRTLVNWNGGNDWGAMDPPLLLDAEAIAAAGQQQNWFGGMSVDALRHGEQRAFAFAHWLLETHAQPDRPLAYEAGAGSLLGTQSGLSVEPYIREGRRILGRAAYGQSEFQIREADLRRDQPGGRDFSPTTVAVTHYAIDIHGCLYRNGAPSGEASSAPAIETVVRPIAIPLESLIPQGVDNLLIGGKNIAVSHIANGATRTHYGEWSIGAAAGATAGWLIERPDLSPPDALAPEQMTELRQHLQDRGLRDRW
ncbi:hypothetical protein KR51_00016030 [Rubidibacter lacunae KORDI 51-2]|uniref:Uncharacterized protein n=1 Tax=Rubidibacter lacunae KORDI 51-2 TaxID=582515 RepID=U5DPX8_9CHRO|nr:FAD-dependent oxidoreductase [Rubidibacter lacunae]ERN41755.1 hypothetical protein KR51_00016030 [Rubidibacter lacunae KORDI 51-2]